MAADTGVSENLAEISQGLYGTRPAPAPSRVLRGDAGRFRSGPSPDGSGREYSVNYNAGLLEGPSRNRVVAHEIAHGIDELAGRIDTSGLKGELQTVYHDLNNPNPSPTAKQWTP